MKNKIVLLSTLVPQLMFAAVETDFVKGFDFTSTNRVTAAMLNQLVDNGYLKSGKGGIIKSAYAPDVSLNNRYTNWLWLDTRSTPPTIKTWYTQGIGISPNSETNWIQTVLAVNSVNTAAIIDGAVTEPKIAISAVTSTKIAPGNVDITAMGYNSVNSSKIVDGTIATVDLAEGIITRPKLAEYCVAASNIVSGTISSTNLMDGSITTTKLTPGLIYNTNLTANLIFNTNLTPNCVFNTNLASIAVNSTNINTNAIQYYHMSTNAVTNINVVKASANLYYNVASYGASTVPVSSYNVATIAWSTPDATITFNTPMANTNYHVIGSIYTSDGGGTTRYEPIIPKVWATHSVIVTPLAGSGSLMAIDIQVISAP